MTHLFHVPWLGAATLLSIWLRPGLTSVRPARRAGSSLRPEVGYSLAFLAGLAAASSQSMELHRCRERLERAGSVVSGVVESQPRFGRVGLRVRRVGNRACGGVLQLRWTEDEPPPPGTATRVQGVWRPPPADMAGSSALGELSVERFERLEVLAGAAARLRWAARGRVERWFPDRSGVIAALVLADRSGLEPELREAFARAGTAHLLAISGFHVGVVAAVVLALARAARLTRRRAYAASAVIVAAYVIVIGAPDAAVRAALLLGVGAFARWWGRPLHRLGSLSAILLVFLAADPAALGRPGFQLSFAGAAGLVLGAGPLDRSLARWWPPERWSATRSALVAGLAATAFTLPIAGWHFGQISVIGIPATLLATPLLVIAIPGILLTLALGPLLPGPASFLAGGVELILDVFVLLVTGLASPTWAAVPVERYHLATGALGAAVGIVLVGRGDAPRRRVAVWIGAMGAAVAILGAPVFRSALPTSGIELRFVDIGQGDAMLLRSPRGRWLVVDAGPAAPRSQEALLAELRRAGVSRISALLLTHPDLDHIGGAASLLASFRVGAVGDPGWARGTGAYVEDLRTAAGRATPWVALGRGDRIDFDGVQLEVLHPGPVEGTPEPNWASLVVHLRYGAFTALLTGDAPYDVEDALVGQVGAVDLLKVAHHGSRTSSSDSTLSVLRPALAVVSAGRGNSFGHPHAEVVERLERWSGRLLRTDRSGTIRVRVQADGSWVIGTGR